MCSHQIQIILNLEEQTTLGYKLVRHSLHIACPHGSSADFKYSAVFQTAACSSVKCYFSDLNTKGNNDCRHFLYIKSFIYINKIIFSHCSYIA